MTPRPLLLDDAAVAQRLPSPGDVRAALRRAFADLAAGRAQQPPQTVLALPDGASDVIVYPGTLGASGLAGVKLSPYLAHRPAGQRITAWTLLLSTDDGQPVLLCDSARLTVERTAGTTALAVDVLAPGDARALAVVGAGPVGLAHLRHLAAVRPWQRVLVSSPALAAGDAARLSALRSLPLDVEVVADATTAARNAEVVCLCTSAAQPLLDLAETRDDVLVTSLSTNAPGAHELSAGDVARCAVYVDSRSGAPTAAAELRILAEDGRLDVVADLAELVRGTARARPSGRAFFRSVGLGLEDLAVAALLLDPPDPPLDPLERA